MSIIADYVATVTQPPALDELFAIPEEPEWPTRFPVVQTVPPPVGSLAAAPTLADARVQIARAVKAYLAQSNPAHLLLLKVTAGAGKTHYAVNLAEELAAQGLQVMYAGLRHDLFADVLAITQQPELWYEWLPRQKGDAETGQIETCQHADHMSAWLRRGYDAMPFCARICGWDYVGKGCPWHAQKRATQPIFFCQHQHVIAHPLKFDVVIGDEDPLGAFMHPWRIEAKHIFPAGLDPLAPWTPLIHQIAGLSLSVKALSGPKLLDALGGAQAVLDACAEFSATPDSLPELPPLNRAEDAEEVDYFHLPQLINLLRREATLCLAGEPYLERVILHNGALILLLRRAPNAELPPHVIWLDYTAQPALYEACFQRPVEVLELHLPLAGQMSQVHNRMNGKRNLVDKDGHPTDAIGQLRTQVEAVAERYQNPGLITYQALEDELKISIAIHRHFYAARGTNEFLACDALIIAGTPAPNLTDLLADAKMIFFARDTPFDMTWSHRLVPYQYTAPDGMGRAIPVGGYWADPDLQAVLWSKREAELIQAAHRIRPLFRDVPVYLLTSLPLAELPPTKLLSINELLEAPPNVDAFEWAGIVWTARELDKAENGITASSLAVALNVSYPTANKYFGLLAQDTDRWETVLMATTRRGRPPTGLRSTSR